ELFGRPLAEQPVAAGGRPEPELPLVGELVFESLFALVGRRHISASGCLRTQPAPASIVSALYIAWWPFRQRRARDERCRVVCGVAGLCRLCSAPRSGSLAVAEGSAATVCESRAAREFRRRGHGPSTGATASNGLSQATVYTDEPPSPHLRGQGEGPV